jgi:hypothetical protein
LLPKLVFTRSGAGVYTFTLPQASYPDERGNAVTVELIGGLVVPQALSGGNVVAGYFETTGVRSGTVRTMVSATNTLADCPFLLFLY